MAVALLGLLGSGSSKTAGTTIAVVNSTGAAIAAGTLIHIGGTWDNTTSTTAPTITCSTIGGATAIANHATASGQGVTTTAGSGIWHQCFRAVTTASIATGATIATLTSNQSAVARAATAIGATGALATLGVGPQIVSGAAGNPGANTLNGITVGHVCFGTASVENNAAISGGPPSGWTAYGGVATTGGGAAANVTAYATSGVAVATSEVLQPLSGSDIICCLYTVAPVPAAPSTGKVKVWSGSAWVEKPVKVWTGSAWVEKPMKVWTGSAWVLA